MSPVWQKRAWMGLVLAVLVFVLLAGLGRLQQLERLVAWTVYTDICTVNMELEYIIPRLGNLAADSEFADSVAADVQEKLWRLDHSVQRLVSFALVFGRHRWFIGMEDSNQVRDRLDAGLRPLSEYVLGLRRAGKLSEEDRSFIPEACMALTDVRQSLLRIGVTNKELDNLLPHDWSPLTEALASYSMCLRRMP